MEEEVKQADNIEPPNENPRDMMKNFINTRFKNSSALEKAKVQALEVLAKKIDSTLDTHTLLKIVEVLDRCSSEDMDRLISLSQSNKLMDSINDLTKGDEVKGNDGDLLGLPRGSMKLVANIHNILPLIKATLVQDAKK